MVSFLYIKNYRCMYCIYIYHQGRSCKTPKEVLVGEISEVINFRDALGIKMLSSSHFWQGTHQYGK